MILTIIAAVVFLAHVAVWLGVPSSNVREPAAGSELALDLETAS